MNDRSDATLTRERPMSYDARSARNTSTVTKDATLSTDTATKDWTNDLRARHRDAFETQGVPTTKNEEWKYTNVRAIRDWEFKTATGAVGVPSVSPFLLGNVGDSAAGDADTNAGKVARLVFVDGQFAPNLSDLSAWTDNGARLAPMSEALTTDRDELESRLGTLQGDGSYPFASLNAANFTDGVYLHVPKNADVETNIHIVHTASGSATTNNAAVNLSCPRSLFVIEEGARVRIIEDYQAHAEGNYLVAPVTEVFVGANAQVEHFKVNRDSGSVHHIAATFARLDRDSHFHTNNISRGGKLVRNDLRVVLSGSGCECVLNGLNVGHDQQLMDDHTEIVHEVAHCASREFYKSILDDEAQGVFNGKVHVVQDAQKTDGIQSNNALILSDKALMNTKPQLEIFADDVRCTHGATIGQLDEAAFFYLRSRGIPRREATKILVQAFAGDVIERMNYAPMEAIAQEAVSKVLS